MLLLFKMLYWFFDGNEPKLLFLFLLMLYIINDYVTDVVVTWSGVIDQLYYFCWPDVKPIKFFVILVLMLLNQ